MARKKGETLTVTSAKELEKLKKLCAKGTRLADIAEQFNVSVSTVRKRILENNFEWKQGKKGPIPKLSEAQKKEIWKKIKKGEKHAAIMAEYEISSGTLCRFVRKMKQEEKHGE